MSLTTGQVLIRPRAESDLIEIWLYIVEQNKDDRVADRFLNQVEAHFASILRNPGIGISADQLALGLRRSIYKNYLVFYTTQGADIVIVRVLHHARDWENVF